MIEEWPRDRFLDELRARDRALVLFYASWCPFSRIFLPQFEAAEPDAPVPFVRADLKHPMDARWDAYGIRAVPTLVYFEHGEEMERVDAVRGSGLTKRDLEDMLEYVAAYEDEPQLPKRMHGPRRR